MITTAKQLRLLADRTGLDAFAEVLRDAAGMVERLEERVQAFGQAPTFTAAQPVAYALFAENGNIRIWSQQPLEISGLIPLYAVSTAKPAAPWLPSDLLETSRILPDDRPADVLRKLDLAFLCSIPVRTPAKGGIRP